MMACINLGQNYAKITHLGKKNIFFFLEKFH